MPVVTLQQGFMSLASCLTSCSYNIPDALPIKSDFAAFFQAGETSENTASTATTVRNMAMTTSSIPRPFLFCTNRTISISRSI
ncbi:MAG: hypothetical protein CVU71_17610 [Deltaproteobacteria bacterium HGW-Deltaproteobacteria-6]|nr:MAG: hypothetical protein CVU71_17610 [Deltaproteobacteria bacterium HGW-Deltaproteobacteria-6]